MLHELFDGSQTPLFTAAKSLALFLTAAVAFRFAQRRTIAEFTPFDWVTAVAVGAIVGRVAAAADTSWLTGAAALLTLLDGVAPVEGGAMMVQRERPGHGMTLSGNAERHRSDPGSG